jgi:hypothetical protein
MAAIDGVGFKVNGVLGPALAKLFSAAPRRCNKTSHPEKMIRAIEPARNKSGFLGRSTCKRSKMDISEGITASAPALRYEDRMTHAELTRFDAQDDPLVLRDNVRVWPMPYAYYRTISLPIIWAEPDAVADDLLEALKDRASNLAGALHRDGFVGVRLSARE